MRIQGGIIAANGFTGILMVHTVMAVSTSGKVKRDSGRAFHTASGKMQSDHLFSNILKEKVDEQESASMDCQTTTYGNDSQIHTFQYRTREYHY